ncbi:hypothetical protein Pcinc_000557 [Petrolisthes cinctipes]|uniref:Uncharacterized protein n=1 Tax=Petrolisthes cinctipes TaxID=88211 RepID=A0AAE1GMC7_PETCI|nr:hypothetical protein Pcinc_000557 [Petrolisthes cinctipes]
MQRNKSGERNGYRKQVRGALGQREWEVVDGHIQHHPTTTLGDSSISPPINDATPPDSVHQLAPVSAPHQHAHATNSSTAPELSHHNAPSTHAPTYDPPRYTHSKSLASTPFFTPSHTTSTLALHPPLDAAHPPPNVFCYATHTPLAMPRLTIKHATMYFHTTRLLSTGYATPTPLAIAPATRYATPTPLAITHTTLLLHSHSPSDRACHTTPLLASLRHSHASSDHIHHAAPPPAWLRNSHASSDHACHTTPLPASLRHSDASSDRTCHSLRHSDASSNHIHPSAPLPASLRL